MSAGLGFKDFSTGEVLTAADVDGYLMQGIWVFTNAAARDAAVTSPQEGNACYLKDTDVIQVYSGSTWVIKSGGSSPLTTKGDLYTYSTTDARLAVGANGTTLVADSSESVGMKWATPSSGGGMTLLSTTTLSGAATDISSISQDYKELRVYMYNVVVNTNAIYTVKIFNGASELSSVVGWRMSNYTTPAYASGSSFRLTSDDAGNQSVAGADNTNFWALTYYDYSATANYKNYLYLGNYKNTSSNQVAWHSFGAVESNSAINKLKFETTSGAFTAGTIEVYGVK